MNVQLSPQVEDKYCVDLVKVSEHVEKQETWDIHSGDISGEEKNQLRQLLVEYRDRFCFRTSELGKTSTTSMTIECTTEKPIIYRPYRLSISEREEVNTIIKDLLDNDIIRPSRSPYASPIFPSGRKPGQLHPIEKKAVPFYALHMDHVGPFIRSKRQNTQVLVMVDGFTKFCIIEAVKSTKTRHVLKALKQLFDIFGVPDRVITDRGTAFTSRSFQTFCETHGIKHILNAVTTPRANGQCERYNRTIIIIIMYLHVINCTILHTVYKYRKKSNNKIKRYK
jgi:hypothetical protein